MSSYDPPHPPWRRRSKGVSRRSSLASHPQSRRRQPRKRQPRRLTGAGTIRRGCGRRACGGAGGDRAHRTHRGSAPSTSSACYAHSASGICPSGATGCADAAPTANGAPANGSSASWRAPSSRTGCAGRSDRRATDHRPSAPSRFHRRTSWRSGRTATRHPAARKQPVRTLARNGPLTSGASRPRWHRTCWSAPA